MSIRKGSNLLSGIGKDGFSPTATVIKENNVATITITDKQGTTTANVYDGSGGQTIQYETMPIASADNLGKIIQYIGTTTTDYTNGYWYKCINNSGTYAWNNLKVQTSEDSIGIFIQTDFQQLSVGSLIPYSGTLAPLADFAEVYRSYFQIKKKPIFGHIHFGTRNSTYTTLISQGFNSEDNNSIKFMGIDSQVKSSDRFCVSSIVLAANGLYRYATWLYPVIGDSAPIGTSNTQSYTPTRDYHPATKKYVDDAVAGAGGQSLPVNTCTVSYDNNQYHVDSTADKATFEALIENAVTTGNPAVGLLLTWVGSDRLGIMGGNVVGGLNSTTKVTSYTITGVITWYSTMTCVQRTGYIVTITGSWSGDKFTVSSITDNRLQATEHLILRTSDDNRSYVPTNNADPTTKKYVDDEISAINIPTKTSDLTNDSGFITSVPLSTNTVTGGIKMRYDSATGTLYIRNDGTDA